VVETQGNAALGVAERGRHGLSARVEAGPVIKRGLRMGNDFPGVWLLKGHLDYPETAQKRGKKCKSKMIRAAIYQESHPKEGGISAGGNDQ